MLKMDASRQTGITLLELLIALAVGLIFLAGILTLVLRVTVAGGESIQATRLNQQLRGTMDLVTKELQRSGYVNWRGSNAWEWDDDGPVTNPYDADDDGVTPTYNILDFYEAAIPRINEFGRIELYSFATPGDASSGTSACTSDCDCILYAYDIDGDGGLNTGQFELFGFRWNDGALETRTAGDVHGCDSGIWQDINDANVEVTSLGFTLEYVDEANSGDATVYPIQGDTSQGLSTACTPGNGSLLSDKCLWRRKVTVSMAGRLLSDDSVTMALESAVKLKNDYFQTAP